MRGGGLLLLRPCSERGEEKGWTRFRKFLVFRSCIGKIAWCDGGKELGVIRVIRAIRVIRIIGVIRVIRVIRLLQLIGLLRLLRL
jgi:hypothetical protein